MTREEMQKVENILFARMHDQREAARTALEIRRELRVHMDASRPGYAGGAGGEAYVSRIKKSV